jgi:hypothetical protein
MTKLEYYLNELDKAVIHNDYEYRKELLTALSYTGYYEYLKVKYYIGFNQIVNCWAKVIRLSNGFYALFFDDNISFDLMANFHNPTRTFYAV